MVEPPIPTILVKLDHVPYVSGGKYKKEIHGNNSQELLDVRCHICCMKIALKFMGFSMRFFRILAANF